MMYAFMGRNIRILNHDSKASELFNTLRKQAYSNILKILPPKTGNFQIKIWIFFLFLLKT